ncbi:hypothetical protein DL767_004356 [Monosporascus sp. MG133]|nr:hypothetical protein DL767_004356 [Monosporascus sp. MG133]
MEKPRGTAECPDRAECNMDVLGNGWTVVSAAVAGPKTVTESMQDRIVRVTADLQVLLEFYNIDSSPSQYDRLESFYDEELADLGRQPFESYSQDEKVDYLLLKNYLKRAKRRVAHDRARDKEFEAFVEPFAAPIREWLGKRQRVDEIDPKAIAGSFNETVEIISQSREYIDKNVARYSKATGYRAARTVTGLRTNLNSLFVFYKGYDPWFDWWVSEPYSRLDNALAGIVDYIRDRIVGMKPGDEESIAGDPIGRDGLLTDLEAELIPYTPEELIKIGEAEYAWCEAEMVKASQELGFGKVWRDALEHVKDLYEPPGSQPTFIKSLVDQGAAYVKQYGLVTVPPLAEEGIRMYMMSPARQRVNPFFLGGTYLQVSFPTAEMHHEDKLMSLRGNNRHFSKATAFHEMIPGHHLQLYVGERIRPYRRLFTTPFFVEGWALYWEMIFWDRGDFFTSPEDRIGALFWRMHRCARIIFSLKFHLGQMNAGECIDLLVNMVGHERATAEGEVRRSFNGDYSPLYQAGYMLGALQLMKLREEALGDTSEREFHDAVLAANEMPIEMLRALFLNRELNRDFKSEWRFYDSLS